MNMRDLIDLFEAPAQGKTGAQLAKTSGGQFMNRADRLNQTKVDAALGGTVNPATGKPYVAGTAAANMALAKKFSQPQTATAAPAATNVPAPSADNEALKGRTIANAMNPAPATDTRAAAAMASKSAPAAPEPAATPTVPADQALDAGEEIVNTPAADARAAAAMASKSAPAAPEPATAALNAPTATSSTMSPLERQYEIRRQKGLPYTPPAPNATDKQTAQTAPAQTSDQIATAALNAPATDISGTSKNIPAAYGQMAEEELEEENNMELEEMMRLSGLALNEKAVSKQQQKFMGMVHAMQKGEKVKGAGSELKKAAKTMSKKDAKDFASTKHKGLPKKVNEGLNLMLDEDGQTLTHIVNRYKHEVRKFIEGDFMPDNLYDALYDYYLDRGDLPYNIAKGREGDPYQWVSDHFYDDVMRDLGNDMNETVQQPVVDNTLSELARLAGLPTNEDGPGQFGMPNSRSMSVPPSKTVTDKSVEPVSQFAADLGMPPLPFFSKKEKADYESMKARKAERQFQQSGSAYRDDAGVRYNSRGEPAEYLGLRSKDYVDPKPNRDRDLYNMQHDPAFKNIQKEDGPGAALLYSKDKPDSFGDKLKSAGKSVRQAIDKATLPAGMHADYDRIEAEKDKKEPDAKVKPLGEQSDDSLNRMRRIAGLKECGDMEMSKSPMQKDRLNVTTNMSSDGTKDVTVNAQGDKADELLQMLKMAGMRSHDDHSVTMSEPEVIMISGDQMMDEERETEYANTPEEEYQTVDSIIRQGNDLNREKRQYADKPRLGDNPMAESILDQDLNEILESILIRDDNNGPKITRDPETGRVHATYPAPKKPDQSELPLAKEPYHGPRSLKVDGEQTGTENHGKEKEVDEGWEDVSNFIGDLVGTEASKLRTSPQLRDLDAMRKQYKGTEWEDQVNKRYDTHLDRLQGDKGEVVGKDGEPIKVLPPQQWKGK